MDHATQVSILKELVRQLDEDENVDAGCQVRMPTSSYVCPDLAAQEWETFFLNHPQLIGLSGDLPEPNTFYTIDDFGVPVLATRDKDGRFRAFVNACRHRGVTLMAEERGKKGRFVCRYHAWTYSTAGELVAVRRPEDFGEVDRSCNGLIELPAVEKYGLLFVHPQKDGALDADELFGGLAPEFASWHEQRGDLTYVGGSTIEMEFNWKLAIDTFGESYHFSVLHRDTLAQIFQGDALSYETFGKNHRFTFARKTIRGLKDKPESEWNLLSRTNCLYYLYPNVQFNVVGPGVDLIRIYPDGENPGRCITRVGHYFTDEAIAAKNDSDRETIDGDSVYDLEARRGKPAFSHEATMEIVRSTLEHQDYAMVATTHRAAESGALSHITFGRNELPLHHYHNTFRADLGLPPLEKII